MNVLLLQVLLATRLGGGLITTVSTRKAQKMADDLPDQHAPIRPEVLLPRHRPWFALVTFCAMTVFFATLSLALIFISATATYAAATAFQNASGGPQNFSGVISDSHCNGRHVMGDKSPEECVRFCVTKGSKYVLVDGEKNYALDGHPSQFTSLSGERVTVNGTLEGTTIRVNTVKAIRPPPPGQ
jgi:hypothetical protein